MAGSRHDRPEDYRIPDQSVPENRHEHRDVNVWAVYKFGIALTILCIVATALLFGLYKYFVNREGGPVVRTEVNDARTLPPMPRLQTTPVPDFKEMRAAEDAILSGYGWVDQAHGVTRIPIDRAIDLLAQRGLATRAQAPAVSDVTVPTDSTLGPKVQRQGGPLAGQTAAHAAGGEEK